jgi:hypothetical protein
MNAERPPSFGLPTEHESKYHLLSESLYLYHTSDSFGVLGPHCPSVYSQAVFGPSMRICTLVGNEGIAKYRSMLTVTFFIYASLSG